MMDMTDRSTPSQLGELLARNGQASSPTTPVRMPDVVSPQKPTRKRYTRDEKLRILRLVDACNERGQIAALLRREGIYYSTLRDFQEQRQQGRLALASNKQARVTNPQASAVRAENARLQRQNQALAKKLEQAQILLDLQKKVSQLLGITLEQTSNQQEA
jgi:transposase